jgi:hypothetical protein
MMKDTPILTVHNEFLDRPHCDNSKNSFGARSEAIKCQPMRSALRGFNSSDLNLGTMSSKNLIAEYNNRNLQSNQGMAELPNLALHSDNCAESAYNLNYDMLKP